MNRSYKILFTLTSALFLSVSAHAMTNMENGQAYIGAKAGQFFIDQDGFDDATAYGGYLGYNSAENVGVEAEYLQTSSEDIKIKTTNSLSSKGEFDMDAIGLYGTYRYHFPSMQGLYVKGKLGLVRVGLNVEVQSVYAGVTPNSPNVIRTFNEKEHDFGVGGGAGLGYEVMPNLSIEGEYSYLDEDVQMASLGAHFKF